MDSCVVAKGNNVVAKGHCGETLIYQPHCATRQCCTVHVSISNDTVAGLDAVSVCVFFSKTLSDYRLDYYYL